MVLQVESPGIPGQFNDRCPNCSRMHPTAKEDGSPKKPAQECDHCGAPMVPGGEPEAVRQYHASNARKTRKSEE
jgi:rRNA maturation endonuclease Nob1